MEGFLKFLEANWGWIAAPTTFGVAVGVLKILAKFLPVVLDNRVLTLLKIWLAWVKSKGLFKLLKVWITQSYKTRASDKLPPMDERGETPT